MLKMSFASSPKIFDAAPTESPGLKSVRLNSWIRQAIRCLRSHEVQN